MMLLFWVTEAWARAGGGHTFSSGGGGGGYSGGGGGDGGDLGGLLLWLVFRYPSVGIPLLIIVVGFILYSKATQGNRQVVRTQPRAAAPRATSRGLLERDANFSEPLFLDLARLVYTRAHEERGRGNFEVLVPFLDESVIDALRGRSPNRPVREVVLGSARIERVEVAGEVARIRVLFQANLTERDRKLLVHERWTFLRAADTLSPGPERMRSLGCPSCGSPIETRSDGRCRSCDTVITDGRLQWRVGAIDVLSSEPAPPLTLVRGAGVEEGTNLPLVMAPDLPARLRAFQARHPEVRWDDLRGRFVEIFGKIQEAWSSGRWEQARPYETDFLFQQHRYWMERYAAEGLRNRLDRVTVTDVVPARIGTDAWLESVTEIGRAHV